MLKYLYRDCPKCGDYLGVVVCDPPESKREVPIDAYCVVCGFNLGWRLALGNKQLEQGQESKEGGFTDFLQNGLDLHRGGD